LGSQKLPQMHKYPHSYQKAQYPHSYQKAQYRMIMHITHRMYFRFHLKYGQIIIITIGVCHNFFQTILNIYLPAILKTRA
jgi:hypothetical protein